MSEEKQPRFYVTTESVPGKPGCWASLRVSIHERREDGTEHKIGEYERNYSALYSTFLPFQQGEQWYALYSRDYTATRVMRLPECEDLGGEEREEWGFCPTGYYVCKDSGGRVGLVTGCVWGDDSSWKIQLLDLRHIRDGKLVRMEDALGYLELAGSASELSEIIRSWGKDKIRFQLPVLSEWAVALPESDLEPLKVEPESDFRLYVIRHREKRRFWRADGQWGPAEEAMVFGTVEKACEAMRNSPDGRIAELRCDARWVDSDPEQKGPL